MSHAGWLVTVVVTLSACSDQPSVLEPTPTHHSWEATPSTPSSAAPGPPEPPLALPAPVSPEAQGVGSERARDARLLFLAERRAAARGNVDATIRLGELAVARGGRGQYALAKAYALQGRIDEAFYWLQGAALDEGVDLEDLRNERAFDVVRDDDRWPMVWSFLRETSRYWASTPSSRVVFILSTGTKRPLVIALHDDGGGPEDFFDDPSLVIRARSATRAFVGVSGTVPLGPRSYRWSGVPEEDGARLRTALDQMADLSPLKGGDVLLLGFGTGAQSAIEIAARFPELYRGAIALSPRGLDHDLYAGERPPEPNRQAFVIAFGSFESFDTVSSSYMDARLLRALGARVEVRPFWLYARHTLPPDLEFRLTDWIEFVNGPK